MRISDWERTLILREYINIDGCDICNKMWFYLTPDINFYHNYIKTDQRIALI